MTIVGAMFEGTYRGKSCLAFGQPLEPNNIFNVVGDRLFFGDRIDMFVNPQKKTIAVFVNMIHLLIFHFKL